MAAMTGFFDCYKTVEAGDLLKWCEILCVPQPKYSFSPKPIDKPDQMAKNPKLKQTSFSFPFLLILVSCFLGYPM